ncbi:MAG: hypothetical protein MJA31_02140 [Clostridia bacterium]|nr:hypothetical protein [Clostridia bacterium]
MPWRSGKVKFDDGTVYPAEFLMNDSGEVWNVKVFKDNNVVEEIDASKFANELGKSPEDVYPFTYELEE